MGGFAFRVGWRATNFGKGFVSKYVGILSAAFPRNAGVVGSDDFGWFSPLFPRGSWDLIQSASLRSAPEGGLETLAFFRVPAVALPGAVTPQVSGIHWSGEPVRVVAVDDLLAEWTSLRSHLLPEGTSGGQTWLDEFTSFDDPIQLRVALARALDIASGHASRRRLPIWVL